MQKYYFLEFNRNICARYKNPWACGVVGAASDHRAGHLEHTVDVHGPVPRHTDLVPEPTDALKAGEKMHSVTLIPPV